MNRSRLSLGFNICDALMDQTGSNMSHNSNLKHIEKSICGHQTCQMTSLTLCISRSCPGLVPAFKHRWVQFMGSDPWWSVVWGNCGQTENMLTGLGTVFSLIQIESKSWKLKTGYILLYENKYINWLFLPTEWLTLITLAELCIEIRRSLFIWMWLSSSFIKLTTREILSSCYIPQRGASLAFSLL